MGGKPKPQTQTVNNTTTVTPWGPAVQGLESMMGSATKAYDATPKTPLFTGPNQQQLSAQDALTAFAPATAAAQPLLAANALKSAGGFYLDPANNKSLGGSGWHEDLNPALQGMITAAINPLHDQLQQNALGIGDAAKMAGAYGGDRGELLKGLALSRFNRDAMDVGNQFYYNSYEAKQGRDFTANQNDFSAANAARALERSYQVNAGQEAAAANQIGMEPAKILAALGDQTAGWDLAQKSAAAEAPWIGLDKLSSVMGQITPYATSNLSGTTVTTAPQASGGAKALGGALGGASAGAAFGPWGAGIGAVVGGLGGLFG